MCGERGERWCIQIHTSCSHCRMLMLVLLLVVVWWRIGVGRRWWSVSRGWQQWSKTISLHLTSRSITRERRTHRHPRAGRRPRRRHHPLPPPPTLRWSVHRRLQRPRILQNKLHPLLLNNLPRHLRHLPSMTRSPGQHKIIHHLFSLTRNTPNAMIRPRIMMAEHIKE